MAIINQTTSDAEQVLFIEFHEKVEPEARALPAERVQKVNLDAAYAVTTALALIAGLRRFRGQFERLLKDLDFVRFDKQTDYTKAFSVANARYSTATSPADELEEMHEDGQKLRELLHADAVTLIGRGVLNSEALNGYAQQTLRWSLSMRSSETACSRSSSRHMRMLVLPSSTRVAATVMRTRSRPPVTPINLRGGRQRSPKTLLRKRWRRQ
jgi:hypothetical protein